MYKSETKKIKQPKDYESLVNYSMKAFDNLPPKFKFYYLDQDGDLITISSQDDYEEALSMQNVDALNIYLDFSIESVK